MFLLIAFLISFFLFAGYIRAQEVITVPPTAAEKPPSTSVPPESSPTASPGSGVPTPEPAVSSSPAGFPVVESTPAPPPAIKSTQEPPPVIRSAPEPPPDVPMGSPAPPPATAIPPGPGPDQTGGTTSRTSQTNSTAAFSSIIQIFHIMLLLIMGTLLGFYYYKNYILNLRIHRLEVLVEKSGLSPVSQEEPVPFSWDQALKSLAGGWGLFTSRNRIYAPGVVGIKSEDEQLGFLSAVNLIRKIISEQNMAVVYLSRIRGEEELGRALLDMESGVPVKNLSPGERQELVARYSLEMSKYESGLFIFQDINIQVDELYDNVLKMSENYEIGLIIVDGMDALASDDFDDLIARLRIVSIKTYIPVVLIDPFSGIDIEKMPADTLDRMTVLMEIKPGEEGKKVSFHILKFQGDPPPDSLNIDPDTGEIGE